MRQWEVRSAGAALRSEAFFCAGEGAFGRAVIEPQIAASYDGPAVAERKRRTAEELLACCAWRRSGWLPPDLTRLRKGDDGKAGGRLAPAAEVDYPEEPLDWRAVGDGWRGRELNIAARGQPPPSRVCVSRPEWVLLLNPSLQLDSLQPLSFDGYHCHYIRTVS